MRASTSTLLFVALAASTALSTEMLAAAPRYKMVLSADKAEHGVSCVSFVENPAIQRGWVALAAATAPSTTVVKLATEAQKQHVTGPALVPGLEILRLDAEGKPYYISFDAATIEAAAKRFAEKGKHTSTNEAHSIALSGNTVFESWIVKDTANGDAAALGFTPEQAPVGTWMLTAHIADTATWAKVQSGELTGFSIEALFDAEELKLAAIAAPKSTMKKTWLTSLLFGLASVGGVKLSKTELKNGDIVDVAEDGTVSQLDADGNISGPLADGEYELPDGTKLVVKNGKREKAEGEGAAGSSETTKVEAADEAVTAVQEVLKGFTAETTAEEAKALLKKAMDALGAPAPEAKPEEVKASAVNLFLESVEMEGGKTFQYNPITRRLLDDAGQMVQTGEFACADGSYFRVNTEQYTYQISKTDYEAAKETATKLAEVELQLAAAPAGLPVSLGGDGGKTDKPVPAHLRFLQQHTAAE